MKHLIALVLAVCFVVSGAWAGAEQETDLLAGGPTPSQEGPWLCEYRFERSYADDKGREMGFIRLVIPQLTARSMQAAHINSMLLEPYKITMDDFAREEDELREEWSLRHANDTEGEETWPIYTESLEYSVPYSDDDRVAFVFHWDRYRGGAHGVYGKDGRVFSLSTGQELEAADVFDVTEEQFGAIVTKHVLAYIDSEQNREDGIYFFDEAKEEVKNTADFAQCMWYLSKDGVVVYYPLYVLAPYACGMPEITIPYAELPLKKLE